MKRFYLERTKDATGTSGTGVVAEGVIGWAGKVALFWRTEVRSVALYDSIRDVYAIHCHPGTSIVFDELVCPGCLHLWDDHWMDNCGGCANAHCGCTLMGHMDYKPADKPRYVFGPETRGPLWIAPGAEER